MQFLTVISLRVITSLYLLSKRCSFEPAEEKEVLKCSKATLKTTLGYLKDKKIWNVYLFAACYACYIAVGHVFHDANRRTAFASMDVCLVLNSIGLGFDPEEAGNMVIKAAQNRLDKKRHSKLAKKISVK